MLWLVLLVLFLLGCLISPYFQIRTFEPESPVLATLEPYLDNRIFTRCCYKDRDVVYSKARKIPKYYDISQDTRDLYNEILDDGMIDIYTMEQMIFLFGEILRMEYLIKEGKSCKSFVINEGRRNSANMHVPDFRILRIILDEKEAMIDAFLEYLPDTIVQKPPSIKEKYKRLKEEVIVKHIRDILNMCYDGQDLDIILVDPDPRALPLDQN